MSSECLRKTTETARLPPFEIQALLDERARTMREFDLNHRHMAIYAIYRADLGMPTGKLVAQCGHAFQLALSVARLTAAGIESTYQGSGNGTKICMYAKNLVQLLRAYDEAKTAGLPCALVIDRGHVMAGFTGNPIITALGIGPCFKDEAFVVTRRLSVSP